MIDIIVFIGALALYSFLGSRLIPRRFYSASNLIAASGAILYGLGNGLSLEDMGIATNTLLTGLAWGLTISIPTAIALSMVVFHKGLSQLFTHTPGKHATARQRVFELGVRIPLGTALAEEIMFRGVLFGLLLQHGTVFALIISSICFGLWHIIPTLNTLLENDAITAFVEGKGKRQGISIIAAVVTTTLAGLGFGFLRLVSGNLVTPWLVHTTINTCAVAGGLIVLWRNKHPQKS